MNSFQALVNSLGSDEPNDSSASESVEDFSDLWLTKPFKENQFWFLRPEETVEAVEVAPDGGNGPTTLESGSNGDEQAIININNLVVKVRVCQCSGTGVVTFKSRWWKVESLVWGDR